MPGFGDGAFGEGAFGETSLGVPTGGLAEAGLTLLLETEMLVGSALAHGIYDVTEEVRRDDMFAEPEFEIERNVRASFTFDLEWPYKPARHASVALYGRDGTTVVFGGIVRRATLIPTEPGAPTCWHVECADRTIYGDARSWTQQYATDKTLKQVLIDLFAALSLGDYGLELNPLQPDGPTFTAPFGWTNRRVSDVWRDLVLMLPRVPGWIYRADGGGVFSFFEAGSMSAPVTLSEDLTLGTLDGGAQSEELPANAVVCSFGPNGIGEQTSHDWTTDGVTTTFQLGGEAAPAAPTYFPGYVTLNSVARPMSLVGEGSADDIHWDPTLNGGTISFDGGSASLVGTGGLTLTLQYLPLYPFTIRKTTGATPIIEAPAVSFSTVLEYAQANAIAAGQLATVNQDPRTFTGTALDDGFLPGQLASIDAAMRGCSPAIDAIVTKVSGKINTSAYWEYTLGLQETDVAIALVADDLSEARALFGGGSAAPWLLPTTLPGSGPAQSAATVAATGLRMQGVSEFIPGAPTVANDYDRGAHGYIRLGANGTITGLAGGIDGDLVIVTGTGTLNHEDASSAVANRIHLPGGAALTLTGGAGLLLIYDGNASRWQAVQP